MSDSQSGGTPGPSPDGIRMYAAEKQLDRIDQVVDQLCDIPGVDPLV